MILDSFIIQRYSLAYRHNKRNDCDGFLRFPRGMRTGFSGLYNDDPSVLAHAHLKQPIPAADSVVSAPQALTLNFSEGIEPGFSGVVVTDAQKQVIKTGTATRDERTRRSSPFRWTKR